MYQGFTHFYESTFESIEGVKEYTEHPAQIEYANELPLKSFFSAMSASRPIPYYYLHIHLICFIIANMVSLGPWGL
jgi:hypothetical protein